MIMEYTTSIENNCRLLGTIHDRSFDNRYGCIAMRSIVDNPTYSISNIRSSISIFHPINKWLFQNSESTVYGKYSIDECCDSPRRL